MAEDSSYKRINWRQAAAEVALIMIGILTALAVDGWWDERSEREDEIGYLKALRVEFMANRDSLLVQIEKEEQYLKYGEQILSDIQSMRTEPIADKFIESLGRFLWSSRWTPIIGTYDELVGSGRLSYLQSDELRVTLASFRYLAEQFPFYRDQQTSFYDAIVGPFLHRNLNLEDLGWIGDDPPRSPFPIELKSLQSRVLWNLTVEWMSLHEDALNGAHGLRQLLAQADKVLDIIDATLTQSLD